MAKHDRRVKYAADTEKPVMVSVRLPRELYERLERYATQYRQSISELVKDGVEMRLEVEADPRSRKAESTTDEPLGQIDSASILREVRDVQSTLARYEARMQAIERQITPAGNGMHDGVSYPVIHSHTGVEPAGQERPAEQATVLQAAQDPALARGEVPTFDTSKYHLGKLCPRGHDYHGTGQSLRNADNQCRECTAQTKREKRAQEKAAREAQPVAD